MVNYKRIFISDDLFWGFEKKIDLDDFDTSDDIIIYMKQCLQNELKKYNFEILIEKLDKKKFYIPNIGKILIDYNKEDTIYMCNHNHETHKCCSD